MPLRTPLALWLTVNWPCLAATMKILLHVTITLNYEKLDIDQHVTWHEFHFECHLLRFSFGCLLVVAAGTSSSHLQTCTWRGNNNPQVISHGTQHDTASECVCAVRVFLCLPNAIAGLGYGASALGVAGWLGLLFGNRLQCSRHGWSPELAVRFAQSHDRGQVLCSHSCHGFKLLPECFCLFFSLKIKKFSSFLSLIGFKEMPFDVNSSAVSRTFEILACVWLTHTWYAANSWKEECLTYEKCLHIKLYKNSPKRRENIIYVNK